MSPCVVLSRPTHSASSLLSPHFGAWYAEKEERAGMQGQWQRESPAKEYLKQVKCCKDTDCTSRMMRQAFFLALKGTGKSTRISSESKQKPRNEPLIEYRKEMVAKDESRKLSTVQKNVVRSTDYLRRIIAPAGWQGSVTMSYLCPLCNSFPLEDNVWWVSAGKKHTSWWLCDQWRKIWLEATKQAAGGANRRKCQSGQGLESACSTSGPM